LNVECRTPPPSFVIRHSSFVIFIAATGAAQIVLRGSI
jgi:hypothetical protein